MTQENILSIDCGTQSLRALVFSLDGTLLAREQIAYEPYVSKHPGWAEQDPEIYWSGVVKACERLRKKSRGLFLSIAGVGVTTQRATMINVDKQGNVLRPAIVWMDKRNARAVWGQTGIVNAGLRLAGLKKKIDDIQTQGKCNWIRQHQPELWHQTYKYLQVSGFLNYRLTSVFADSVASQIGYLPFNYKQQKWAQKHHLVTKLFPIEKNKLPRLVKPSEWLGEITMSAARQTGLKKGTPVIACGSDKGCESLSAGLIQPQIASLSFGTTATVQVLSEKYVEPLKYLPAYPAVIPGKYNPEIEIFRGFWMITWFKRQFAEKEVETAQKMGIPAEELLNQCLKRTRPGAMGLVLQPYWGAGLDHPDAKGAMIGFGDVHTKDHIYRAVVEGLGFALYNGLETLERITKLKFEKASVSGGASQSDEICRIFADIFNLPIEKGHTHETSGLGAAILVAKGLNVYASLKQAVAGMVQTGKAFHPDSDNVKIYQALYSKVYQKMYQALRPLYKRIRNITGYPDK